MSLEKHTRMVEELLANHSGNLTAWEAEFLESLMQNRINKGRDLTDKQADCLMPIVIKHIEGGDPRSYEPEMQAGDWFVAKYTDGYHVSYKDKDHPVGKSLSKKECISIMRFLGAHDKEIFNIMDIDNVIGEPEVQDNRGGSPF